MDGSLSVCLYCLCHGGFCLLNFRPGHSFIFCTVFAPDRNVEKLKCLRSQVEIAGFINKTGHFYFQRQNFFIADLKSLQFYYLCVACHTCKHIENEPIHKCARHTSVLFAFLLCTCVRCLWRC